MQSETVFESIVSSGCTSSMFLLRLLVLPPLAKEAMLLYNKKDN